MHTVCISVYTVSGNISRIAAILPELLQNCQNSRNIARILIILICMQNPVLPQRCSNIAEILPETVTAILPQYCGSILPEGLYYDKASVLTNNLSFWDGSYEYPQHMLWLRNRKVIF